MGKSSALQVFSPKSKYPIETVDLKMMLKIKTALTEVNVIHLECLFQISL